MAKVGSKDAAVRRQLSRLPVAGKTTLEMLPKSPTSRSASLDGVQTRVTGSRLTATKTFIPVVGKDGVPLMPTTPSRARRWVKRGEATPFFRRGIFCVRLNREPSSRERQEIAVGIDPGSKKEGFTIKSSAHTFLNIQADAVTWVKEALEARRMMRRVRRSRKTPCRANRKNRARGCLTPSTKARWQWKLRITIQLITVFPITDFVVEDIKACSTGKRRWDRSFSPLEVGKKWFYEELEHFGNVHLKQGWETAEMRTTSGLKKSKSKMSDVFEAHCVDSWVLANWYVGGHIKPDNMSMLCISPIRLHRRQLHAMQPAKDGFRRLYGGTRSLGLKRGSVITHPKYGKSYIGGTSNGHISLHALESGERLTQDVKPQDCRFVAYNTWRVALPLPSKADSLRAAKR